MRILKRTLASFLALCIVALNLPIISFAAEGYYTTTPTGYTSAEDVDYKITSGIVANWGARGETATFLSEYAEDFYTGSYTYENLILNAGGTTQNNAHNSALYSELNELMTSAHNYYTYYDGSQNVRDYYMYADCVSNDTSKVSLLYLGGEVSSAWNSGKIWNQEHVWPKSKLSGSQPIGDLMQLRPADPSENSSRSNTAYGEGGGYYDPNQNGTNVRGDCARILLYMYVRWESYSTMWGSSGVIENLDTLLKWMEEDPVDTWEMGRNDSVQSVTGTRNVFVDYPELAFLLFGEDIPEDMPTPSDSNGSSSCSHSYTSIVTPPSCTEAGSTKYTCKYCGRTYSESFGEAAGHKYSVTSSIEATCLNKGSATYTCSVCLDSYTEATDALGHNYIVTDTIDPTETTQGYNVYTCTRCGDSYTAVAGGVVGDIIFRFGEDGAESHVEGSLVTSGEEYTCGDYTLTLESASKVYGNARDAKGNGAMKLGTSSSVGSFSFTVPGNITKVIIMAAKYKANASKLTVNGETYTLTTNSNDGMYEAIEVDTSSNKTVSVSTVTGGVRAMISSISYVSGCAHSYSNDCDTSCNICGFTRPVIHKYVATSSDATCTQSGEVVYTCSVCGDSYSETVVALGHDFVAGKVIDPTYTSQGYTIYTCSRCDATENRDFTDPLTPPSEEGDEIIFEFGDKGTATHSDGSELKVSDTFTNGDYTLKFNSVSKAYKNARDAKGNSAIKLGASSAVGSLSFTVPENITKVILNLAKYKSNTSKVNVNDTAYTLTKNSNDGQYDAIEVDTSNTKTVSISTVSGGYRAMMDSVIFVPKAAEHTHSYKSTRVEPTCTENGKIVYICSCGDNYEETIPALDHDYDAETTAPSCGVAGKTVYTCSLCGDSYEEEIAALEHNFVAGEIVAPQVGVGGYTVYTCSNCGAAENRDFTDALPEPEVPDTSDITNIALEATDVDLIVTWTAPANVEQYTWVLKNDADGSEISRGGLAADATSFKVSWPTLEYGVTYRIGIRAKTAEGWKTTQVVTGALVIGNRVVDVKTESVGRSIKVTWKTFEGADKYIIYVFNKGAAQTTANIVTSLDVNDGTATEAYITNVIAPEVDYIVCVRARANGSYTGLSTAIAVDARLNVYAPEAFFDRGITPNKVAISWDEVRGADKYWVMLTDVETGEQFIRQSLSSMASVPNLTPGKTYSVKLNARITDANGTPHYAGYSAVLGEITTPVWEDLNVTATEEGNVSWSAHTNAIAYYVYRKEGTGAYKKIATVTDATTYTDAAAKSGKTYTYAIKVKVADDLISTNSGLIKGAPVTIA